MGSTWGNYLKLSIFGESHGKAIGVTLDGFPAGVVLSEEEIQREMARRAPGQRGTTPRKEADIPILLSGVLGNVTTGAPICAMIENTSTRSKDYENLRTQPRPSHSDRTGSVRYRGYNDIRGGGHFSGRLTAPLVFAGALCKEVLRQRHGVTIGSHVLQVDTVRDVPFSPTALAPHLLEQLTTQSPPVLDDQAKEKMYQTIEAARMSQDSVGGIIECGVTGLKEGVGSPMLQSVESRIASLLYGIPAVKGVEFGDGFALAAMHGSQANDCYQMTEGKMTTATNHNGGILGGITTGMPLLLRVAFKPTPSISQPQMTWNNQTQAVSPLIIEGRHDPCIALRAPAVVEAAVAIALLDLYLEAYGYDA